MSTTPNQTEKCAWYLRCSQPSQLLEHQRQPIERYVDENQLAVPASMRFEDKGGRRHESAKRHDFQRLLDVIREEKIDWVLIAHLDRWGVADVDEFFSFRSMLREHGVRVWSVTDQLDLTSVDESDRWRIFGQAMANERAMISHAEKNIAKNVQMVLDGWWPSGNHAYGLDMMCCRLSDRTPLFRVHLLEFPNRKNKRYRIIEFDESGRQVDDRVVTTMPSRNSKQTGYRLVPSMDESRIETVNKIFELFDQGMTHSQICDWLQDQNVTYFGRPFRRNTVDPILSNTAYLGSPAWGKSAIGHYRQSLRGRPSKPVERKRGDSHHQDKTEADYVQPREPLFEPLVDPELFQRVKARLDKIDRKPKPRRRNKSLHPMNGLVKCPDCGCRMVNSHGTRRDGSVVEYFVCSTHTRSRFRDCRTNSVQHAYLDECGDKLFAQVQGQLKEFTPSEIDSISIADITPISIFIASASQTNLCQEILRQSGLQESDFEDFETFVGNAFLTYVCNWENQQGTRDNRVEEIEDEINKFGDLIESTPSSQLAERWSNRLIELEAEKDSLTDEPNLVEQAFGLLSQAKSLSERLSELKRSREGELWASFLESVVPIMKIETMKNGKTRTHVQGFRFLPKDNATEILGEALEISCSRKDRGSSLRRA